MSYENSVNVSFGLGCGGDHLGFGVGGVQPTGIVWKSVERKFFAVSILLVMVDKSILNKKNYLFLFVFVCFCLFCVYFFM